jgi:hypothetical protein
MPDDPKLRTKEDIERAVRALAHEFKTDTIFIIGSQAILMSWPDAPEIMRGSPEIDAYPENARVWEIEEGSRGDGTPLEASEHIHGLFGEGSLFHNTHGFYIDGVDEGTARLPRGWHTRAMVRQFDVYGRMVLRRPILPRQWPREQLAICAASARVDYYPASPVRSGTRVILAPSALSRSSIRS